MIWFESSVPFDASVEFIVSDSYPAMLRNLSFNLTVFLLISRVVSSICPTSILLFNKIKLKKTSQWIDWIFQFLASSIYKWISAASVCSITSYDFAKFKFTSRTRCCHAISYFFCGTIWLKYTPAEAMTDVEEDCRRDVWQLYEVLGAEVAERMVEIPSKAWLSWRMVRPAGDGM